MLITFLFDNFSNSDTNEIYESVRNLRSNDSIRGAAISVINEAASHGVPVYNDGVHDKNEAISVYVSSSTVKDANSGWKESGFGIKYSIDRDGSIRVLNGYEPLGHDWTPAELDEIVSAGYIKGETTRLIVARPIGLGAAPQDFFDWLGFMANTLQVIGASGLGLTVLQKISTFRKDHPYRKIAKQWKERGIRNPESLREFIDTKAEWKLEEVKKRLRLDEEFAIKLLMSLGMESVKNAWRMTQSKQSIKSRKRWMRNEKKYKKTSRGQK